MLEPKLLEQIIDVAAVAAYKSSLLKGKGDKNAADQAAVDAMRQKLNELDIYGKVVIGEGEMDEAPMLYIGEILGKSKNPRIDIAVDPLDGTKIASNNQQNALSVNSIFFVIISKKLSPYLTFDLKFKLSSERERSPFKSISFIESPDK